MFMVTLRKLRHSVFHHLDTLRQKQRFCRKIRRQILVQIVDQRGNLSIGRECRTWQRGLTARRNKW